MLPPPPPPSDQLSPYLVEVRRPVHIKTPLAQHRQRTAKRRANAAKRRASGDRTFLDTALDVGPISSLEEIPFVLVAMIVIAAIALLVPWVFLGVAFLLNVLIWVVAVTVGFITVLAFRRPYRVVVVSKSNVGSVVAEVGVRGKKRADRHAGVVEKRLFAGIDPFDAVRVDGAAK